MGFQLGATYTLLGPDGTEAIFNGSPVTNRIGVLTGIAGLDSAPVRTGGMSDLPEADGAAIGSFYRGARPVTLEGVIVPDADTATARNAKISRFLRACDALRGDAVLRWTEDGTPERALWLRLNSEPKITGAPGPKNFQVGFVSADAYIRAYTESSASDTAAPLDIAAASIVNQGNALAWPRLKLTGAASGAVEIVNETTGAKIKFVSGFSIAGGQFVEINTDPRVRTVLRDNGTNFYGLLDFAATTWPSITTAAGGNRFTASGGTRLDVYWRHAWSG